MRSVAIALLSFSLLVAAGVAGAETYMPLLDGGGGMMLNGADYTGNILAGGLTGTWSLDFDDSLWPDQSDSTARFDYIWTTFFADNYDGSAGSESWRGYFDGTTLPTAPRMSFFTASPGGDLVTNASVTVLIRDYNADGVLQQSEKHHNSQVAITVSVETPLCTGYFEDYCGTGSLGTGNLNFINPPDEDAVQLNGQLQVNYCGAPVDESSWGTIKTLFR